MKICNCDRYEDNMVELDLMLISQIQCKGGYKGEAFEYCPWCGTKLIIKKKGDTDEPKTD